MAQDPNTLYRVLEADFELDSPEAINKWRENRKRKFPTPSNIEKKKTEKAETVERGQKFLPKRLSRRIFRYEIKTETGKERWAQQRRQCAPNINTWVNRSLPENKSEFVILESYYANVAVDSSGLLVRTKHTLWDPKTNVVEDEEDESLEDKEKLCSSIPNGTHLIPAADSITDEDEEPPLSLPIHKSTDVNFVGAKSPLGKSDTILGSSGTVLTGLVGYGIDSELEDGELPEEIKSIKPATPVASHTNKEDGIQKILAPNSNAELKERTDSQHESQSNKRRRNRRRKPQKGSATHHRPTGSTMKRLHPSDRAPTLLRRLLDDQICEERNAVLFACRFLVQNNFLHGMENSEDVRAEFLDCIRNSSIEED